MTCLSFGDLQPREIILMGETSCPYQDSSFTRDSFLMNGGAYHHLSGKWEGRWWKCHVWQVMMIQFANFSRVIHEYDDGPVHPRSRFKTLMSYNIPYCQSSLPHRALQRGAESDHMTASQLLKLCRCAPYHWHFANKTWLSLSRAHTHTHHLIYNPFTPKK